MDKYTKKCKMILLSNDFTTDDNIDINIGQFRPINMDKYPFDSYPTTILHTNNNKKCYIYAKINIPKIIHFMWFSKKDYLRDSYPDNYIKYINSWKQHNDDYQIVIWTRDKIEKDIFPTKLFIKYKNLFDKMKHIEKCDFLRYIVMYLYGGIYSDLNNFCNHNITPLLIDRHIGFSLEPIEHNEMFYGVTEQILLTNSFLISSIYNTFWLDLLESINSNYYQTKDNLFVMINTGPYKLGKFVKQYYKDLSNILISNCYTQIYTQKNQKVTLGCENRENYNIFHKKWKDTSGWGLKYNSVSNSNKYILIIFIVVIIVIICAISYRLLKRLANR